MFKLFPTSLEHINLRDGLNDQSAGAFSCFEGLVRDHNDGKNVVALEYEAHEALCQNEARKIFDEARTKFNIINVKCFHRIGKLAVGEMAVFVGATAAHRDDAFKACRYIIDEVKARLPIWKKEFYANGDSDWVGCETCGSHQKTARS